MKRHLLSLLALTAAATAPRAATALIVHQKSGGTVMFAFKEKPVLTYRSSDGITYLVVSEGQESVSYPFPDVQKLTFDDVADDMITRITAPTGAAPQPTYIYNVSGVFKNKTWNLKENTYTTNVSLLLQNKRIQTEHQSRSEFYILQ